MTHPIHLPPRLLLLICSLLFHLIHASPAPVSPPSSDKTSILSASPCPAVCLSSARAAYEACWADEHLLSGCHVTRCRHPTLRYRGWSCTPTSQSDASPRPSPVVIARRCRNVCRTTASSAWDDCLYRNRTVSGCAVSRCAHASLSYPGWICSPVSTSTPIPTPTASPSAASSATVTTEQPVQSPSPSVMASPSNPASVLNYRPRPSQKLQPLPSGPVTLSRGCRDICRTSADAAWDDCLYRNRTVFGCEVKRCPTEQLPFKGWICTPIHAMPSVSSSPASSSSPSSSPSSIAPASTSSPSPIPSPSSSSSSPPVGHSAFVFTDPHLRTFDGLAFDCQGLGEFTLLRSAALELEVQARFRGADTSGTVTKGIAVRLAYVGTVQYSISFSNSSATRINDCPISFFVNGSQRALGQGSGISDLSTTISPTTSSVSITTVHGITLETSVYYSETLGCYFESLSVFVPSMYAGNVTGLLGSPNNNPFDDWTSQNGTVLASPRDSDAAAFGPAYDYCVTEWCVKNTNNSLFTYERGTTFDDFSQCDLPYGEPPNFSDASPELVSLCGNDHACLIDGLVGSIDDALVALRNQADVDDSVTLVQKFRALPPVMRTNFSVSVRLSVDVSSLSLEERTGLTAFSVMQIDPSTGDEIGEELVRLYDNGEEPNDFFEGDGIFSNSLAVKFETAGETRSYIAMPVVAGVILTDAPNLTMIALHALRSYSDGSGLGRSSPDGKITKFEIETTTLDISELSIRYSWPNDQTDLDTATAFGNATAGFSCGAGDEYLKFAGDRTETGGTESTIVRLGRARKDGLWRNETMVSLKAGWYTPAGGSGPASVRAALRLTGSLNDIKDAAVESAIDPGAQSGCSETEVATLKIRQEGDVFVFQLITKS